MYGSRYAWTCTNHTGPLDSYPLLTLDDNRGYLLDAGFPQIVVSLLEGYAETLPVIPSHVPFLLSDPHLKIVKTAVGALLNLSLGYGKTLLKIGVNDN